MKKITFLFVLFSSIFSYSQDTIFINHRGDTISGKDLSKLEKKRTTKKIVQNNQLKSVIYSNFLIKEKPQASYTGIFQNGKPYDGYFINKIILNEIPLVDFYEKGELKYQYSFDFLKQLDNYQFYEYDQKSVYKNGKIVDGFEFFDSEEGFLIRIGYKNEKANYLEMNLFAMHAFNRLSFDYNGKEIVVKDFEKQTSIKLTEKNNGIFAEVFDENGKLIVNNQQKEVQKSSPNSTTIFKIENNQLKEENISPESLNPLIEKVYKEINPLIVLIYSAVACNRTMKIDDLFNQFAEIFKSNNIQKLFSQESFIEGPNKVLSSLSYNKNGNPDWGIKISETEKKYLVEFYKEGKVTFTKKVNSIDEVQETINSLLVKPEEE
ncbi:MULTISPECIES: hypothetical protein [Empedobacter]|uniref:MORN repeat variant n=1 Tax=Empedobacter falsenii TaxID=343874 RepID=A0A7H9DVR0_9FLAO|nr:MULTISPECIES: hypothetical protein [Empedobacter]MDH2205431.1 hypothetical protein [Empedobacter sp. GD03644]QLL59272.1 hypothetical protein FH779_14765 [Empedobacter falsenii]